MNPSAAGLHQVEAGSGELQGRSDEAFPGIFPEAKCRNKKPHPANDRKIVFGMRLLNRMFNTQM